MPTAAATILVVDNMAGQRALVAASLESRGYRVVTAGGGMGAMDRLCFGPAVDLIVTSLNLPDLDGYHLVRAVRSEPVWHVMPIIVLADAENGEVCSSPRMPGADAVMFKPLAPEVLVAEVSRQLARSEAARRGSTRARA